MNTILNNRIFSNGDIGYHTLDRISSYMDWSLLRDIDTKLKNTILNKIKDEIYNNIRYINYYKKTRKDTSLFGFSNDNNCKENIIKEAKKILDMAKTMDLIKGL